MTEGIELDCGIAYRRLAAWLDAELGLRREADGPWLYETDGGTCEIEVTPLPRRSFRVIALEHCRLTIRGDGPEVSCIKRLFDLRFMSAGG